MMAYKFKPSKNQRMEFAKKMQEIDEFCKEHNISCSLTKDSYYFTINGQKYRVSNHTIEASNRGAYNWLGEQIRDKYHEDGRDDDTIYITASKTRIIEIYNNLLKGYTLDKRGNIVEKEIPDVADDFDI